VPRGTVIARLLFVWKIGISWLHHWITNWFGGWEDWMGQGQGAEDLNAVRHKVSGINTASVRGG
jgi:hypothetical protein